LKRVVRVVVPWRGGIVKDFELKSDFRLIGMT
jgi:hypothetical protein